MKIELPEHIKNLKGYKPGKPISELIAENNWEQTAILWNNENPMGSSSKAKDAIITAFEGSNFYPDPLSLKLRGKLAERLGKQTENIIVGNGSEGLLLNILKAFCSGKEEVLTSSGSFVIIYIWSQINNTPLVQIPLTADYRLDLEGIAAGIGENTKVIYLSNANNPTGAMITREELTRFMEVVPEHILVVLDEAYFEFSVTLTDDFPDGTQLNYSNIIVLRTFSKAYGIAASRIGYGIASKEIIQPLLNVKLTFEPSNLAQAAGIGALDDEQFLKKTMDNNTAGINYFYQEFDRLRLNYVPSFANFVMIDFGTKQKVDLIVEQLMSHGVFVRPLGGSGLPHCIRISVGRREENNYCIEILEQVLNSL